jgi:cytochrome c-type biogenesis protein CcmE
MEFLRRTWKLILAVVAVVLVVLWLALFLTVGGDFYVPVEGADEALAAGESVRVGGQVAPGSLQQEGELVTFTVTGESGAELAVAYHGAYPERLGPYEEVVVYGARGADGTFEATQVLIKCPDKLFPEKATNSVLSGVGLERLLY